MSAVPFTGDALASSLQAVYVDPSETLSSAALSPSTWCVPVAECVWLHVRVLV